MTSEVVFTMMIGIIVLAGLYMVWWMERQDRKEEEYRKSQHH